MNGEEFLNKLYKQLNLSAEVMHTSSGTKNKDEAVKRYMDRLELIHNKVTNQHELELLKNLYYKKYIVREEDIPRYRDKEKIITAQKESLDKWLNYLLDENARYPMWAKYWAFQGMLTIGTFNEITGTYQKRSKKTLAPFIEVNPEMLSKCIGLVVNYVEKNELTDTELEKLVESGNFSKLYTISLKNNQKKLNKLSDKEDGIWVTYHYESLQDIKTKEKDGIEPEYLKLYKSLQGYNTGWCTAGDKEMAKAQICGSDEYYDGGNFYVYYTKNVNNEYKVPRIAIRMDGTDEIGEIKGIEDGQNLEEGLEDIIESKLQTLGLKEQTIINYLTIISNMKKITELNKKAKNKVAFNTEDIKFIYGKIECFGWEKDPRIEKILETRNIENDFSKLSNDDLKELIKVDCEYFHHIPTDKKHNKEIAIVTVRQNGFFIQYIPG